ncbi:MAG: hypothetical protein LUF87_00605 [Alistipes sp.]|nr:hypothetical protein [Alistipes sp.]
MRACILTQIKYPTGGYTVFTTEANRDANNTVVGGLRVSKITSYSDNGKIAFTRTYEYEDPVYLYEPKEIDYTYDMYVITGRRDVLNHRRYFYTEEPLVNVNLHRGSAVMYRKVTSYLTTDNTTGKQITYYRTPEKFNAGGIFPTMESVPWTCGNVEKEEFYATGAVNPVKIKEYGIDCTITSSQNGFISRSSVIPIFSGLLEGGPLPHDDIFSCYVAGFTSAPTGRIYVQNITETDYDLSGKELTRKKTDYNYRGDLITGLNYQGSDGEYQRLDYEYPHTIASKTSVHNTMVSRNMINKTLKTIRRAGQWDLSGGTPVTVNTSFIDYQLFNGNLIKPARIDISYNDPDVVTTEMTFLRYDSYGNVSEVTGKDGTPVVYLWGYMGRYLIAELRNVTYQQVAQYVNPETIAARTEPTAAEFRTIDNLRQQFPEASITTFKYSDHIGIVEQTDPAGITTTFTYDPKGRLSGTFDHNGMQLFEHSYGLAR